MTAEQLEALALAVFEDQLMINDGHAGTAIGQNEVYDSIASNLRGTTLFDDTTTAPALAGSTVKHVFKALEGDAIQRTAAHNEQRRRLRKSGAARDSVDAIVLEHHWFFTYHEDIFDMFENSTM